LLVALPAPLSRVSRERLYSLLPRCSASAQWSSSGLGVRACVLPHMRHGVHHGPLSLSRAASSLSRARARLPGWWLVLARSGLATTTTPSSSVVSALYCRAPPRATSAARRIRRAPHPPRGGGGSASLTYCWRWRGAHWTISSTRRIISAASEEERSTWDFTLKASRMPRASISAMVPPSISSPHE